MKYLFSQEDIPQQIKELLEKVESPADIDGATESLGIEAKLMNPHLSATMDLSPYGLSGEGVHIPVQISTKYGGRQSMYYLKPNEKANTGLFLHDNKIYFRNLTRLTGESYPAETGDTYLEELVDMNRKTIFKSEGVLRVIDAKKGIGSIEHNSSELQSAKSGGWKLSLMWSFFTWEEDDLFGEEKEPKD